jgi:hypothetical protein
MSDPAPSLLHRCFFIEEKKPRVVILFAATAVGLLVYFYLRGIVLSSYGYLVDLLIRYVVYLGVCFFSFLIISGCYNLIKFIRREK